MSMSVSMSTPKISGKLIRTTYDSLDAHGLAKLALKATHENLSRTLHSGAQKKVFTQISAF